MLPFATAFALTLIWLVAKLALDWLDEDGGRMLAALRGQSMKARALPSARPVSVRYQPRAGSARRPTRATVEWRAAA